MQNTDMDEQTFLNGDKKQQQQQSRSSLSASSVLALASIVALLVGSVAILNRKSYDTDLSVTTDLGWVIAPTRKPTEKPVADPTQKPTLYPTGNSNGKTSLCSGDSLSEDQFLSAPNSVKMVYADSEGGMVQPANLRILRKGELNWSTRTLGCRRYPCSYDDLPGKVIMQSDGNLVIYAKSGEAVWSSNTRGRKLFFTLECNGNGVIYDQNWNQIWKTDGNTNYACPRNENERDYSCAPLPDPTPLPVADPTQRPKANPTSPPVKNPTNVPAANPTTFPISKPTSRPTANPIADPTKTPISNPTVTPISDPTSLPIAKPSEVPISYPTAVPISDPTVTPISDPTSLPIANPTEAPISYPTAVPISDPTEAPISDPTAQPAADPTEAPVSIAANLVFTDEVLAEGESPMVESHCALFAYHAIKDPRETPVVKACANAGSGELQITEDDLKNHGIIVNGKSHMSEVIPGKNTKLTIFSSPTFGGGDFTFRVHNKARTYPPLTHIKLSNQELANDNVFSVLFEAVDE